MNFKEIGINTRSWVDSAQDTDYWRVIVNVALNLLVPEAMELIFLLKHFGFCFCGTYHWCFRDSRPQKGIRMGL